MKSKLFSSVKQFWQLIIYKRHFLSQEETEAVTDFRFSILIFGNRSMTCHRDLISKYGSDSWNLFQSLQE